MEGNLNQFISIQAEHDVDEQRSIRTPEDSYTLEDEEVSGQDDPEDSASRYSERISEQTSQASRAFRHSIPENGVYKGGNMPGCELRDLADAVRSLERTINNHGVLFKSKNRNKNQVKSDTAGRLQSRRGLIRGDKVTTYIRVVFLKIGEIDTLKETFSADTYVQAKWREPALDNMMELNIDEIQWDKYWNPKIFVENSLGDPKETVWQTLTFNSSGEAMVYERRRIKGVFLENLELDEFPFDTQDLTVTVTSERSEQELALEEDSCEISSINVQSFVDEQEWKLHSHVETWKRVTTKIYQNSKYKHPAISSSCRASRRPGFFVWNIFLVMLFICSLCFTTFSVDLVLPQNRLQLSFILLLTTITFKFVVSQTLPRISYLTYLDKYILTSMGILCIVCIWHAIVPLLAYNSAVAITADRCSVVILGSAYFMFHVCFFMYIYFVALKKRWKYDEKDREHKERMKRFQKLSEIENSDNHGWNAMEPI